MSLRVPIQLTVQWCALLIKINPFPSVFPFVSWFTVNHCCLTLCVFIFNLKSVVECRHAKSKRDTGKPPPCGSTSHHPVHGCSGESSVEVVG